MKETVSLIRTSTEMPAKKSKRTRPTAHDAFISEAADDGVDQLPLSDEEDEPRSRDKLKIIAQEG